MKISVHVIVKTASILLFCLIAASGIARAQVSVEFSSGVQFGSQSNNVSLLAISDPINHTDLQSVKKAKWKNVTKKAKWGSDKELTPSGSVDLNKIAVEGKPLYIAFRYLGEASAKPSQRSWSIQHIKVTRNGQTKTIEGSDIGILQSPTNHTGAGWNVTTNGIRFSSNRSVIETESWAIIKVD